MSPELILPGKDRNETVILQELLRQEIRNVIGGGYRIPVGVTLNGMAIGPVEPHVQADGRVIVLERFARFRPVFETETSETGVYLPAYVLLSSGVILPADEPMLRPYVMKEATLTTLYGRKVHVPLRRELTCTHFGADRILEMERVGTLPWMHVVSSDLPELARFLDGRIALEGEAMLLGTKLLEEFVNLKRREFCESARCENGSKCPNSKGCLLRGCKALYSKSSKEAGTAEGASGDSTDTD